MKRQSIFVLAFFVFTITGFSHGAVSIEFVTVGNAGNADDDTGYGGVGYEYQIGKYEVTTGQYIDFLNAVAATDIYGLYNTNMDSGDTETGAYTITDWDGTHGTVSNRNVVAKAWIPSEDEWYKAAYHKNDGITSNYFRVISFVLKTFKISG